MIDEERWKPSRQRGGRAHAMTPEQQALAEDLHVRALSLRAASEDGLSIREAVALAAVQLGLGDPVSDADGGV